MLFQSWQRVILLCPSLNQVGVCVFILRGTWLTAKISDKYHVRQRIGKYRTVGENSFRKSPVFPYSHNKRQQEFLFDSLMISVGHNDSNDWIHCGRFRCNVSLLSFSKEQKNSTIKLDFDDEIVVQFTKISEFKQIYDFCLLCCLSHAVSTYNYSPADQT